MRFRFFFKSNSRLQMRRTAICRGGFSIVLRRVGLIESETETEAEIETEIETQTEWKKNKINWMKT